MTSSDWKRLLARHHPNFAIELEFLSTVKSSDREDYFRAMLDIKGLYHSSQILVMFDPPSGESSWIIQVFELLQGELEHLHLIYSSTSIVDLSLASYWKDLLVHPKVTLHHTSKLGDVGDKDLAYTLSWSALRKSVDFWVDKRKKAHCNWMESFQAQLVMNIRMNESIDYERSQFGGEGFLQILQNSLDFCSGESNIRRLTHSFDLSHRDVFICGAGPSLKQAESFLKKIQSKALIIAAGTAAPCLQKMGIFPQILFAVDPFDHQIDRVNEMSDRTLVTFMRPRWNAQARSKMEGPCYMMGLSTGYGFADDLFSLLDPDIIKVAEGLNVVSCALNWALMSKAKRVVLLGLDWSCDQELYADPSIGRNNQEVIDDLSLLAKCNDGKKRKTSRQWLAEKQYFEELGALHKGRVFRFSPRGLSSELSSLSLSDLEFFAQKSSSSFDLDIEEFFLNSSNFSMTSSFPKIKSSIGEVKTLLLQWMTLYQEMLDQQKVYSFLNIAFEEANASLLLGQRKGESFDLAPLMIYSTLIESEFAYEKCLIFWDRAFELKNQTKYGGFLRLLSSQLTSVNLEEESLLNSFFNIWVKKSRYSYLLRAAEYLDGLKEL